MNTIIINTPGPQGPPGMNGVSVDTSSLVTTSSFNDFTSSYNTGSFTGSFAGYLYGTASYALNADINTGSFAITGSNTFNGNQTVNGYIDVTGNNVLNVNIIDESTTNNGIDVIAPITRFTHDVQVTGSLEAPSITGSLEGTSSWAYSASNAITASYVLNTVSASHSDTASYVLNAISASYSNTASYTLNAISASYSNTASYVVSASYSDTASYVLNTVSASYSNTASYVVSASYSNTASYVLNAISASYSDTASYTISASYSNTASYVQNAKSASYVQNAQTASYISLIQGPGIIINGLEITASVQKVNGIFPVDGNILTALSATKTGTSASLIQSASGTVTGSIADGLVWIISNDPNPTKNGDVYIFSSGSVGQWYPISPLDTAASDARYLKLDGTNSPMTGDVNMGGKDLTNVNHVYGTASWADSASYALTASYVQNAISASYSNTASYVLNAVSASYSDTASYVKNAQTASYVLNAISASYSDTASYVKNAISASYVQNAISASYSDTASYVKNAISASYVLNAISASYSSTASYVLNAISASYVQNAESASYVQNAISASYVKNAESASYVQNAISASHSDTASYVLNAISASYSDTASYVKNAQTASYVLNAISASYSNTASYVTGSIFTGTNLAQSASYALTASYVPNAVLGTGTVGYLTKVLSVDGGGNITALETSSIYESGATRTLSNSGGTIVIDYENVVLNGKGEDPSIDAANRTLIDSSTNTSINYENRTLIDSSTNTSINYENRTLLNSIGKTILDYQNENLFPCTNNLGGFVYSRDFIREKVFGSPLWDFGQNIIYDGGGNGAITLYTRTLRNFVGVDVLDWENRFLISNAGIGYNWGSGYFVDSTQTKFVEQDELMILGQGQRVADSFLRTDGAGLTYWDAGVQSVNGVLPTNGNVSTTLSATRTGTSASLVASSSGNVTGSLSDGLVWVISNDPTPANNGDVYIFSSGSVGQWYPISPLDTPAADARYLKLDGGNPMTGNIDMGANNITNVIQIYGTASWANNAQNVTGSIFTNLNPALSASYALSSSHAISSSQALTASYITGSIFTSTNLALSASYTLSSSYTISSSQALTASYIVGSTFTSTNPVLSASYALSSSRAISSSQALTASYIVGSTFTSINPALSASYALSSSYTISSSQALTASYITGSTFTSINPALSASYALTASYALNGGGVVGTAGYIQYPLSDYAGADFGAKLQNAINSVPTGSVIDCYMVSGSQTISSTITINKPVTILLGRVTITANVGANTNIFELKSNNISIIGKGRASKSSEPGQTRILMTTSGQGYHINSTNTTTFVSASNVTRIQDLDLVGVQSTQFITDGSGGIFMAEPDPFVSGGGNALNQVIIEGVYLEKTKGHAITLLGLILSSINNTRVSQAGGHGVYVDSSSTSTIISNTYVSSATLAGFCLNGSSYSNFINCGAEGAGIGYWIRSCFNVTLVGCGAESNVTRNTTPNNLGITVPSSVGTQTLNDIGSDYTTLFKGHSFVVTGGTNISLVSPLSALPGQISAPASTTTRHFLVKGTAKNVTIQNPRCSGTGTSTGAYDIGVEALGITVPSNVEIIFDPTEGTKTSTTNYLAGIYITSSNTVANSTIICDQGTNTLVRAGNKIYSNFILATGSALPTYVGREGEIKPIQIGPNYFIATYIGGAWRSASLF